MGGNQSLRGATPATVSLSALPVRGPTSIVIEDEPQQNSNAEEAIRRHAAALIPCPADEVRVRHEELGSFPHPFDAYFADGCGQRVVYSKKLRWYPEPEPHDTTAFYIVARFATGRGIGPQ
jgi:hypothetical protein